LDKILCFLSSAFRFRSSSSAILSILHTSTVVMIMNRWTELLFLSFLFFAHSVEVSRLPIVDISPLVHGTVDKAQVIRQIGEYCRNVGFFYISGHGVDLNLQSVSSPYVVDIFFNFVSPQEIDLLAKEYFSLSDEAKKEISMRHGGKAWRGSFLVGDEMTRCLLS
jgi:hypothetical protein